MHYTPAIEECQQYCWEHCNASNSSDEKWRSRQNFQMNKRDNEWVFFSLQFFFSLDSNSEIFTCDCNLRMKFDTSIIKLTFISHSDETLYLLKSDMLLWFVFFMKQWNIFQFANYRSTNRWHFLHSTQYTQSTNHDDTQLHLRRNKEYEIIKTDKIDQMYVCSGCMCECVNVWMHAGSYLCICSVAYRSPREWMRKR